MGAFVAGVSVREVFGLLKKCCEWCLKDQATQSTNPIVWVAKTGKVFHTTAECSWLKCPYQLIRVSFGLWGRASIVRSAR